MPRRNSNVVEKKREFHGATHFHSNYKEDCAACPFVGINFSCRTSDGKCLKSPQRKKAKQRGVSHGK